ncbi:YitT family protein [Romboutsia sp. CE17]|uniref:YitT family protein n=1 Tax=Romboutsia sp. CE17 TaxID=2724150 RepID=UPI001442CBF9|nr:YitT family protein [Romboutsia sp. CE17]QJA09411.1 YitT family protein [Romboutsia sp. CE17]
MKEKTRGIIIEAIGLIIGCLSLSIGINMFLTPHTIAPGGLSGLSVVISKLTGLSVSTVMIVMCIPLVICSVKILGKKDSIKTLIGTVTLSLMIKLTSSLSNISATEDPLLAAISGAIFLGAGIGIVFSVDGSTGGTDLIALMINRIFPSIPLSKCLTFIDGMVVLSAGIANRNIETGLYSAIALFVVIKMVDVIISGVDHSKAFMIITDEEEKLREAIFNDIKRGVTVLDARGGYTNRDKNILLVVVQKKQEVHLKKLIKRVDSKAFIIVSDVHEVLGEGFKEINV